MVKIQIDQFAGSRESASNHLPSREPQCMSRPCHASLKPTVSSFAFAVATRRGRKKRHHHLAPSALHRRRGHRLSQAPTERLTEARPRPASQGAALLTPDYCELGRHATVSSPAWSTPLTQQATHSSSPTVEWAFSARTLGCFAIPSSIHGSSYGKCVPPCVRRQRQRQRSEVQERGRLLQGRVCRRNGAGVVALGARGSEAWHCRRSASLMPRPREDQARISFHAPSYVPLLMLYGSDCASKVKR